MHTFHSRITSLLWLQRMGKCESTDPADLRSQINYDILGWAAFHGKDELCMLGSVLQLRAKRSNSTSQFQRPSFPLRLVMKSLP